VLACGATVISNATLPAIVTGVATAGNTNFVTADCGCGVDDLYLFTVPAGGAGNYRFDVPANGQAQGDPVVSVSDGACSTTLLDCNDDRGGGGGGPALSSRLTVNLAAGQTVTISVSTTNKTPAACAAGYSGSLTVSKLP